MSSGTPHGKQILMIDADASHREDVVSLLQQEGHSVQGVPDDQQALERLRQQPADLILLAPAFLHAFTEARRQHLSLAGTPLVVLGSDAAAGEEVDVVLPRPVPRERLLAVVQQYLSRPKPVILVVEDDLSIRRMFQVALEAAGFVVWQTATGPATVELFEQHAAGITLVLLDVQLTGPLDGPQTLLALRRLRPDFPCCFMTGHAGTYTADELLALGASHVFAKPFPSLAEVVRLLWALVPPPRQDE